MKQIRLRAWDEELNKMVYNFRTRKADYTNHIIASKYDKMGDYYELKIMQSVNMFDKNRIEIYEGDIIECWNEDGFLENFDKVSRFIIEYHVNCFSGKYFWDKGDAYNNFWMNYKNIQIVGNIYQNPELTVFQLPNFK